MSDTDFKAAPMQLEEARYSYRNSQQISSQTGLIGYLRADMGTNGNEFWSTWNDYRKDLKTDDFKSEFDPNYSRISGIAYENGYVRENSSKTDTLQSFPPKKGALLPWGSDNF